MPWYCFEKPSLQKMCDITPVPRQGQGILLDMLIMDRAHVTDVCGDGDLIAVFEMCCGSACPPKLLPYV
jgi:hypothetical protein